MNLLRTQRDRLETQITNLLSMTVTAQRVVDQKDAEIKDLQERQKATIRRENNENNVKFARMQKKWFSSSNNLCAFVFIVFERLQHFLL